MSVQLRSFPCPGCSEFINTSKTSCPFCSTPIDAVAAQSAAEVQEKVNDAYNDASHLRIIAGVYLLLLILGRVPFLSTAARLGSFGGFLAVPILFVRWHIKYAGINTTDPDYARAKKLKNIALLMWAAQTLAVVIIVALIMMSSL